MSIPSLRCCCVICKQERSSKGIHNHYNISHTENGKIRLAKSGKMGSDAAKIVALKKQKEREQSYDKKPNYCQQCNNPLPYKIRKNKFCGHSCSASFNNKKRIRTEETNQKVSQTLKLKTAPYTKVKFIRCEICNESFIWNNIHRGSQRFCSSECLNRFRSNKARTNPGLGTKRSTDEIALFELCNDYFNHVTSNEKAFNGWDADILIYDNKTAILWNGPWHYQEMNIGNHSLARVQNRDRIKKEEIKNAGWEVIVFEDRFFTPQSAFDFLIKKVSQL